MSVKEDSYTVQLHLLDLSGFSIFRDLIMSQLAGANYIIYMFDFANEESFKNMMLWRKAVEAEGRSDFCTEIIVGNKTDLMKISKIDESQVKQFAEENKLPYFLTSCVYL